MMPATWDKKPATGPQGGSQPKLVPPQTLKERAFRSQTLQQQAQRHPKQYTDTDASRQNTHYAEDDQAFWQNEFDNRLNGLGIRNGPERFEVRRGKTVPRPDSTLQRQLSPPHDSDDPEAPPSGDLPPRNPRRLNPHDWRPTSSIYGDNETNDHHHPPPVPSKSKTPARDMYGRPTGLDISPPSSPDISAAKYGGYHEDVSPIDDSPDQSQQELLHDARDTSPQAPRSHIPTMRREKQSDAVQHPWEAVPSAIRGPTAGRPEFGLTTTVTGPQVHRSGNPATTFGQRMRQLTRGKTEPVESRPPWNGASGRAPLVEPVRDDLAAPPLNIGRRNSKRGARTGGVSPETSNTAAATVRRLLPSRSNQKLKETSKTPSPEPSSHMAPSHAYPSPPYNDSPISQSHPPALASHPAQIPPRLAPNLPDPNKAIRRKPSPSTHVQSHNPHHSTSSSVYTAYTDQSVATYVPHLSTAAPTSPFTAEDPWVPPPSRFSVTTCNTVIPDSPRSIDEDRPPMPPMPPAQQQLPSVMDRRRPVPGNESAKSPTDEPIVISIKSTLSSSKAGADRANADRPISITSTTKALPLAPPEMQSANDRVAYLNARLESLAHRRTNINRGIKQMTELMPTDNLMSSTEVLRKREIEKQKVEDLKEELSEIQREEYDLGLKLYRANKRLERESDFEGSALWVRRATG
ncbi:hypothetical protein BGZ61DRAFT_9001 [Ilyonectria robusta]|uniref:uncharacterized protein n=1 Tax=Ilyonectria robusta TaxID=1079257 RepID=UPI001E8CC070|nr:uncharacterized protein BGZ61DRAFT_9001 [Ilyonectria robusta]KAH8737078.1 hypothetical protein BGZ61DRAFT_9001 [Ilyonectria robusta]